MNTQFFRRYGVVVVLVLVAILFAGCASAPYYSSMESPAAMPAYEMAASDESAADAGAAVEEMAALDGLPAVVGDQRKIVGTANIDLVVSDTDETVAAVTQMVAKAGGYVADTNFYRTSFGEKTALQGNMTLRVPAQSLDGMVGQLADLAVEVTSQSLTRDDVTDQYTDLSARLRNLEATEAELLELLSEVRAKPGAKPEDILAVHRNIMEIRGQIEQVKGRMVMLDNLTALSTIHLSLSPDTGALPIVEAKWRPDATVSNALRALVSSLQTLGDAAIWLTIYVLPVFLLLLLPVRALCRVRFSDDPAGSTSNGSTSGVNVCARKTRTRTKRTRTNYLWVSMASK